MTTQPDEIRAGAAFVNKKVGTWATQQQSWILEYLEYSEEEGGGG